MGDIGMNILLLTCFAAYAGGQVCISRFVNGKWESSGDCGDDAKTLKSVVGEIREKAANGITSTAPTATQSGTPSAAITTPQPLARSCDDVDREKAISRNGAGGVYKIDIPGIGDTEVYCDTENDGGNWTVFQRRMDGRFGFFRDWVDYVNGFGNISGEFWLGLDKIHALTKDDDCELRIDMIERNTDEHFYATYRVFEIGNSSTKYKLKVGDFSGNTTDALAYHNNTRFSTRDQDNDNTAAVHCAVHCSGGWWFNGCHTCNLNGLFDDVVSLSGIIWHEYSGKWMRARFTEMKIRRRVIKDLN